MYLWLQSTIGQIILWFVTTWYLESQVAAYLLSAARKSTICYFVPLFTKQRPGVFLLFWIEKVFSSLTAEILELAGNAARDNKKGRVTPRHILLAVANDEELNQVKRFPFWVFPFSSSPRVVIQNIRSSLHEWEMYQQLFRLKLSHNLPALEFFICAFGGEAPGFSQFQSHSALPVCSVSI